VSLLLWSIVLLACSTPSEQRLQADLRGYLVHVREWAPTEAETARAIDRIVATQFVDDAEVRRQVAADAPRVDRQIARVQAVEPATKEMRAIHARYLEAWRGLAAGYATLLAGIDAGDATRIAAGRRALDDWRAAIVETATEIKRLADRVDVSLDGSAR